MAAKPEMGAADKVRIIGAKICSYANGSCLCTDKKRPLCSNVKALAIEFLEIAGRQDMTREEWNKANQFTEALAKGPKRVRSASRR